MPDLVGRTLGQYRIIEQLGRGGMATVYKAYQPSLERYVAIKVLASAFTEDPAFIRRFKREATAIAGLQHPNIVPVYDFGWEGDVAYIVMQYISGGALKGQLGQPADLSFTVRVISQVAAALDYAHGQGIVHRDIKPANILLTSSDWVLLTDFGIAKMVSATSALTQTGRMVGTPQYMSPEQAQGEAVDARSDIYSLGVVLYEMLTGQPPFDADTPLAVVLKHISAPLPLPSQVVPDLPEAAERVIIKALAKAPGDRYQTAGALAAALGQAVSGEPVAIPVAAPTPPPVAATPVRAAVPEAAPAPRHIPSWLAALAGLLVGAAILGGGVMVGLQARGPSPPPYYPAGPTAQAQPGPPIQGTGPAQPMSMEVKVLPGEVGLKVKLLGPTGGPMADLEVDLWKSAPTGQKPPDAGSMRTGQDGVVSFKVEPGEYWVGFNAYGFPADLVYPMPASVSVSREGTTEVAIKIPASQQGPPGASLEVNVRPEGDVGLKVRLRGPDGRPLKGLEVDLWKSAPQGPPDVGGFTTDSDGVAFFKVPSGRYWIGFNLSNFPADLAFPGPPMEVNVAKEGTTEAILKLTTKGLYQPGGPPMGPPPPAKVNVVPGKQSLAIKVLKPDGSPMVDLGVAVFKGQPMGPPDPSMGRPTDRSGKASWDLPAGDYAIAFNPDNFPGDLVYPGPLYVTVKPDSTTTVDVTLEARAR
ncbi:MAG: protein kinase [Chloroflexi bacterium]|nr:protein kinase [Chloroflexota bacterium]